MSNTTEFKVAKGDSVYALTRSDFEEAMSKLRMFHAYFIANELNGPADEMSRAIKSLESVYPDLSRYGQKAS